MPELDEENTEDQETEDPQNEPGEEDGGDAGGEEPAAQPAAPAEPPKAVDEMKIVIIMRDDSAMLLVSKPDCDPHYKTMTGTLAAALKAVPGLVKEAREKWATSPRYPKAVLPAPPAPPPAPPRPATRVKPAAAKPAPTAQPKFF